MQRKINIVELKQGGDYDTLKLKIDNNLEIACGNKKSIKVTKIQRQGKNIQNIGEFMLGSSIKKDTNLNNA